jgi:hypothetical protein
MGHSAMGGFELHAPCLLQLTAGSPSSSIILRSAIFESKSSAYEWCISTLESELC